MKQQVGVSNVKVVLTNTCTGQEKVITILDDHYIVVLAVGYFARTESISVYQVDIQISSVPCHA